jgi:mRNA-degrading endonuclease RelE of RelBE toxin-antitoxin system
MIFYSTPSFLRHFKKLDARKRQSVIKAIENLNELYNLGLPSRGLGLKQLRQNLWEIRSSLKDRILFDLQGDAVSFLLVGNHDDVRSYLKNL